MSRLRAVRSFLEPKPYLILALWIFTLGLSLVSAQEEVVEDPSKGKIAGTVVNDAGAPVSGAKIEISSRTTDTLLNRTTDQNGKYESSLLQPGQYMVRIEAKNFRVDRAYVTVKAGAFTKVDRKMVPINPGPPTLLGKIAPEEIAELPINGRNALNTAQFQPEVLVQDGRTLDPTKSGSFAVSVDKVSGLASRYTLDGIDINDQSHGAATQSIALSAIDQMTVSRAAADISTGLTTAGAVSLKTYSGANPLHGEAFGFFRDHSIGFANQAGGQDLPFTRSAFGGKVGGALIKDKAFFFLDAERVNQNASQAVSIPPPFQALTGRFSAPYRNTAASARLDWQVKPQVHAFYRFSYDWSTSVDNFGDSYSIYSNRNNAPAHAGGVDFTKENSTNSLRFGYLHYHNTLTDATAGANLPQLLPGASLEFSDLFGGKVQFGPSIFAPQETLESNLEGRYDGTRVRERHTYQFGGSVNRITAGGYAIPNHAGPLLTSAVSGGVDSNPLDYPLLFATLGDGQGAASEKSGFGFPQGGQSDLRFQAYFGDAFRFRPNLTLTYGIRYVYDTGLTNSDLGVVPCSAVDTTVVPSGLVPCTGSTGLLNQFGVPAGQGNQVRRPYFNFAPQFGFAWDPYRNGRTLLRGGIGIYYDDALLGNAQLDRSLRLDQGLYRATTVMACTPGAAAGTVAVYFPNAGALPTAVTTVNGLDLATQVCGQPVGTVAGAVQQLQSEYQAAVEAAGAAGNPYFVGRTLSASYPVNGLAPFDANYYTPRSYQINIGVRREAWKGGILTADYVRNVSQRFSLIMDENHVGDFNYLYKDPVSGEPTAALNAVTRTLIRKAPACLTVPLSAGAIVQDAVSCYIATVPDASINDFAVNGLDSGAAYLGGEAASAARGVGPAFGAAFAGLNPTVGQGTFQTSAGHSVYNGLQTSYRQNFVYHGYGLVAESLQVTYTFSKFNTDGGDVPTGNALAYDFRYGAKYRGRSPLDRHHQVAFGGSLDTKWGPRLTFAGHFASSAPSNLTLAVPTGNPLATPGEIFRTDFTGDGTPGDLFPPPTSAGPFSTPSGSGLMQAISKYNATQSGLLTPAGQELVTAQVMTAAQLATLHATTPFIVQPPADQVSNPWYKSVDLSLSWPLRVGERFQLEPSASLYNLLNFANFASLSGKLAYYYPGAGTPPTAGAGSVNGTPSGPLRDVTRIGPGSGVFGAGAARQMEFGVKITF